MVDKVDTTYYYILKYCQKNIMYMLWNCSNIVYTIH